MTADTWPEWRPGMLSLDGRRVDHADAYGHLRVAHPEPMAQQRTVSLDDLEPPDTDDPATVGCIHAQAEEAWGCEVRTFRMTVNPLRWAAVTVPMTSAEHRADSAEAGVTWGGATRGEALLACWRAAQGRAL